MRAWRIYDHNAAYAKVAGFDPLGGVGGLHGPARWHHKGRPVLYASSTPSLALLEVLVHETSVSFRERTLLQIDLDDDIETITPHQLVRFFADSPAGEPERATRDYGTRWLEVRRSLALVVPSVVMPYENNIIINPAHPQASSVRITHADVVTLDHRLLNSLGATSNL